MSGGRRCFSLMGEFGFGVFASGLMSSVMKVLTVVGARPQFVKVAVVSRTLRDHGGVNEILVHTGRHFDDNMSDIFFHEPYILASKFNLGIRGGPHGENTGRALQALEPVMEEERPDCVLVYGDTDSRISECGVGSGAGIRNHVLDVRGQVICAGIGCGWCCFDSDLAVILAVVPNKVGLERRVSSSVGCDPSWP